MDKRIVVSVALAVLLGASAYAQTTVLFAVVQKGTPQEVQAAIDKGADVNAYSGSWTPLISAANANPNRATAALMAAAV